MFRTCISFAALVYLSSWALYGIVMSVECRYASPMRQHHMNSKARVITSACQAVKKNLPRIQQNLLRFKDSSFQIQLELGKAPFRNQLMQFRNQRCSISYLPDAPIQMRCL